MSPSVYFKWASTSKEVEVVVRSPSANAEDIRDVGLIPGSGRSPGGGYGNPFQCSSCLGNSMVEEPGRLQSMVVTKSRT